MSTATRLLLLASVCGVVSRVDAQDPESHYQVQKQLTFDVTHVGLLAVDPKAHRLYGIGDEVVNTDNDSVVGTLPADLGHGYAIAAELRRGITRRGAIFDLHSLAVIRPGATESGVAVVYDHSTRHAFVLADTLLVLDVASGANVALVPLGGKPKSAVAGDGWIYFDRNDSLFAINVKAPATVRAWHLAECTAPGGLAYDRTHSRLFASCDNGRLAVIDTRKGQAVASVPIKKKALAIAFDANTGFVFNPNGDGTMNIIREDAPNRYTSMAPVSTTDVEAAGVLDETTHRLYLLQRKAPDHLLHLVIMGPSQT